MWYVKPKDELYHHGIKGQKWGVRRFQNPDGSVTSAGAERYYVGGKKAMGDKGGTSVSDVAKSIKSNREKAREYNQKAYDYTSKKADKLAKQKFGKTMAQLEKDAKAEDDKWRDLDDQLSSKKISQDEYGARYRELYKNSAHKKINEIEDQVYDDDDDDSENKLYEKAGQFSSKATKEATSFADNFIKKKRASYRRCINEGHPCN